MKNRVSKELQDANRCVGDISTNTSSNKAKLEVAQGDFEEPW